MRRLLHFIPDSLFVAVGDILAINLSFILAFVFRFGFVFESKRPNIEAYEHCLGYIVVFAIALVYANDLYASWVRRSRTEIALSSAMTSMLLAVFIMALGFWQGQLALPRSVIVLSIPFQAVILLCYRLTIKSLYDRHTGPQRLLIVADDEESAYTLAAKFAGHAKSRFLVTGLIQTNETQDLRSMLQDVDAVAVSASVREKRDLMETCTRAGKQVFIVPDGFELLLNTARPEAVDDVLLFAVRPTYLTPMQLLAKRLIDLVGSAVMLFLTTPLMLASALLIVLTSKGPVLFKQERLGRGRKPYMLYKFRTMVENAESHTGPVLASDRDPRITPVGSFLRATRLDELPQIFNVLKGEMSLVGPRPERKFFIDRFEEQIPNYGLRMIVKPGITGLAQVLGRYSTTAERKLSFDLMYMGSYSFLLDFKILIKTIGVVLKTEQANGVSAPKPTRVSFLESLSPSTAIEEASAASLVRSGIVSCFQGFAEGTVANPLWPASFSC